MQELVAETLKEYFVDMPFVNRVAGLAQVLRYIDTEGNPKRMPIDQNGNALVPDSSDKGLIYFEHVSLRATGTTGEATNFESILKLVFWGKLNPLAGAYDGAFDKAFLTASVTPTYAQLKLMSRVPMTLHKSDNLARLMHSIDKVHMVQDDLFSKYTYKEEQTQYLLAPYTAFGFDIKSTFTVSLKCASNAL
jgi:hypothetical protein